jgi:hypothetical protein
MPLNPWGEYRPDVSDYEGKTTKNILNVIPQGDGYAPFPAFANLTAALPAACRGGFYALKSDGSVATFGATVDRIYLLNNTDQTWIPVSKVVAVTSITNASPAVVNYTAHPFAANDPVVFSTDGALPLGLTAGTVYYVMSTGLTANAFQVSASAGGVAINTSSAGSGTHSVTADYSDLSSTAQWQFVQFNSLVIAVQANAAPQVYDLSSASAFVNLLGSPPQAAYVSVVGRFVVLSGLLSTPFRVQWSGLNSVNASTSWTSGVNSSDYQDLPDGGIVRGVAGGEYGTIFQDQAIRRMTYAPGSAVIFQIERIAEQKGLFAPYSVVRSGDKIFFHSAKGFHKIEPGGLPVQIGRERVDRTFFADLDKASPQLFIGAADPRSSRVYWAYKSASGTAGLYDKIIGYDDTLDRFFPVMMSGEYLLGVSQAGLTLESLDAISGSIDALVASLDSYSTSVTPEIAQFSSEHKLGFFRGSNLEATCESAEVGTDGERIFIRGFRPITDAAVVYGSCSSRETQQESATAGTEVLINSRTGRVDLRNSTRYSRFKARIPAGTSWTFTAGVEPDVTTEGMQ